MCYFKNMVNVNMAKLAKCLLSLLRSEFQYDDLKDKPLCEPPLSFLKKLLGSAGVRVPRDHPSAFYAHPVQAILSTIFSFLGIAAIALVTQYVAPEVGAEKNPLLIGSMGATAVLIYAAPTSPLAQPRNLIFGHIFSALIGIAIRHIFLTVPDLKWLAAALAVSLSIGFMSLTRTLHPPGGATALIAIIGAHHPHFHGFAFLLTVIAAVFVMLTVALLTNNMLRCRSYPLYWV